MRREGVKQQGRGRQGCCLGVAHAAREHPCTPTAIPSVPSSEGTGAAQPPPQQPCWMERQSQRGQQKSPFLPVLGNKASSQQVLGN